MKKFILVALLLVLASGCLLEQRTEGLAKVIRVIDGDTIEVAFGTPTAMGRWRVRYIGIDCPELNSEEEWERALAIEALNKNKELVENKVVNLVKDVSETDRHRRLLRYVYDMDDLFVNGELVRLGLARAVPYPPDTAQQELLAQLEAEARAAGRGIWAHR